MPTLRLFPLGVELPVRTGSSLSDILFPLGVEFPCGGEGTCGGCRVRLLRGELAISPEMRQTLTEEELRAGWRLACCARVAGDLTLEIEQWTAHVLADDTHCAFEPRPGCAVAFDVGTTTLAAQLVDLETGAILGVRTALNPQAVLGADIMTRVKAALEHEQGAARLASLIRGAAGALTADLVRAAGRADLREVWLCGNTVMHHLFGGVDVEPLSHVPFEPSTLAALRFAPRELGWNLPEQAEVIFLPCIGGFVGSDVLAGIAATGIAEREELAALLDLGTNGEIVLGNRHRLLAASTAAGPAFEAGCISMGMRAAEGAITHVYFRDGGFQCRVLGGGAPRGICGSGLVSAVALARETGLIGPGGRFANGKEWLLADPVRLTQGDIRQLQLAKGAIAAGVRLLLEQWGASLESLRAVYLAGAFGNYVDVTDAWRLGLLEMDPKRVHPAGNAALRGTKLIALNPSARDHWLRDLPSRVVHVSLHTDARFQDTFVDCLAFPEG